MKDHKERAHSKFSASGTERWFQCPGSVQLSEGLPDIDSVWSIEGTLAHEVLEATMRLELSGNCGAQAEDYESVVTQRNVTREMVDYANDASDFILGLYQKLPGSEVLVETRIYLDFIHPEAFGTFDAAVIDFWGTLHVFDYKYGAGHAVSPTKNLQMIFYGIGLANKYRWNFKRIRPWIIQPRIKGYDGPSYWELPTVEMRKYVDVFKKAVDRVERYPNKYVEGQHCHWCKAKAICPLKQENKLKKAIEIFKVIK